MSKSTLKTVLHFSQISFLISQGKLGMQYVPKLYIFNFENGIKKLEINLKMFNHSTVSGSRDVWGPITAQYQGHVTNYFRKTRF